MMQKGDPSVAFHNKIDITTEYGSISGAGGSLVEPRATRIACLYTIA